MNLHSTSRILSATLKLGLLLVLQTACGPQGPESRSTGRTNLGPDVRLPSDGTGELDFGDDWDRVEASIGGSGSQPDVVVRPREARPVGVGIALATFTGGPHRQQAAVALQGVARQAPELASALRTHEDERGSMLVYGQYAGFDDPALRRDLKRLKNFEIDGKRVFGLVMPAELRPALKLTDLDPLDLRTVRLRNPDVRVIYTLEVAWWGPVGDANAPRRRTIEAESLAQVLRRRGHEAFFLHEPHRDRSSVCVGVFDFQAVDAASGIESPTVMRTRQSFPGVMVNGEQLTAPSAAHAPNGPRRPVPPALIDVPRP